MGCHYIEVRAHTVYCNALNPEYLLYVGLCGIGNKKDTQRLKNAVFVFTWMAKINV
jgi:hypothetical protein